MHNRIQRPFLALASIAAVLAVLTASFAAFGGWFSGGITAQKIVDELETAGGLHPGYRRNHAKGICVTGMFKPSINADRFSNARAFSQASVPVVGRFSISGGDPHSADGKARVRGLGLLLKTDDGQEWRMALGNFPFFPVATPEGFAAQAQASRPDPTTGKPDPNKMKELVARYPELTNFLKWAKTAPFSTSLANTQFNGINAFQIANSMGRHEYVRWSLQPQAPFEKLSPEQLQNADTDFLGEDLVKRLAAGPLSWDLVLQFAAAGDPIVDASKAWPETRRKAVVGRVTLTHSEPQENGICRDINFDPLILPQGISGTDDPILQARSSAYSVSFNRREEEISRGHAPASIMNKEHVQ